MIVEIGEFKKYYQDLKSQLFEIINEVEFLLGLDSGFGELKKAVNFVNIFIEEL